MSGAQKSAILFLCLGEERGGAIMQQLDVGEIRQITAAISNMGEVDAGIVEEIIAEFDQKVNHTGSVVGSIEAARGLLKEFLPEDRVAEIIRECSLEGVRDELPHSIAVVVQEIAEREDSDVTDVYADIVVERDSQKAIIIGRKGARLRDVGAAARGQIEALIGARVYLSLHVKVAKEWQRDPKQLGRLGF